MNIQDGRYFPPSEMAAARRCDADNVPVAARSRYNSPAATHLRDASNQQRRVIAFAMARIGAV